MFRNGSVLAMVGLLLVMVGTVNAQSFDNADEFTYQGYLEFNGTPFNGTCNIRVGVFDVLTDGAALNTKRRNTVPVTEGVFNVNYNFGPEIFAEGDRYLEIAVDCNNNGVDDFQVLSPRQPVTPAPLAMALPGLYTLPNTTSPNVIGGYSGNTIGSSVVGGTIAGGGLDGEPNLAYDNYSTVSGGSGNIAGSDDASSTNATYATVGGGEGNTASGFRATVGGGFLNEASGIESFVGGGEGNTASGTESFVGGGEGNVAGGRNATVGGGLLNEASGVESFVGGGDTNTASGVESFVGGGEGNTASGTESFVGGGEGNIAGGPNATVGGGFGNTASNFNSTVGGGFTNTASGSESFVGGGEGNTASGTESFVGGGEDNVAGGLNATVGGGLTNTASGDYATVGGGFGNTASGFDGSTVSGGANNMASGSDSTVGGGDTNTASGFISTVGGGFSNEASGQGSFVGGGNNNEASGIESSVGGGFRNEASGADSTVGGGRFNTASGFSATVPGGSNNVAAGDYSFAAGLNARLTTSSDNTFLWNDGTFTGTIGSSKRFIVVSGNGVAFYTAPSENSLIGAGVNLSSGSSTWSSVSDRNAKMNIEAVDSVAVLEAVAQMPISTWNYTAQGEDVLHMGPMAQDFHGAFGLGIDDKHIDTVDADGVSLAAIQGLYIQNEALEARVARLERQLQVREGGIGVMAVGLAMFAGYWFARRKEHANE